MKGNVFRGFCDFVEKDFSAELLEELIERAQLPSGGAYTTVGYYPTSELERLCEELAALTGRPVGDLLAAFGRNFFATLAESQAEFMADCRDGFDFLCRLQNEIHAEVKKLHPKARPPAINILEKGPDYLLLEYVSERNLPDFARGLLDAACASFGNNYLVEPLEVGRGASANARFRVTTHGNIRALRDQDGRLIDARLVHRTDRFEATVQHSSRDKDGSSTRVSFASSIAFAGGKIATGRRVSGSFAIVTTEGDLDGRIWVDRTRRSGSKRPRARGNILISDLGDYRSHALRAEAVDIEPSLRLRNTAYLVKSGLRTGAVIRLATDKTFYARFQLMRDDQPLSLKAGHIRTAEDGEAIAFFTNGQGIAVIEFSAHGAFKGTIDGQTFSLTVPESDQLQTDIGIIEIGRTETVPSDQEIPQIEASSGATVKDTGELIKQSRDSLNNPSTAIKQAQDSIRTVYDVLKPVMDR